MICNSQISNNWLSETPSQTEEPTVATSAFKKHQPLPHPPTFKPHHRDIWNLVNSGLKAGRTYKFARCCATIFDTRRASGSEVCRNHTSVDTMYKALGKRSFESLEDLSQTLSVHEDNESFPLDRITINRNHDLTQLNLKLIGHEKVIKELMKRIEMVENDNIDLKAANLELERKVEAEIMNKNAIKEVSRSLLKVKICIDCGKDKICPICQKDQLIKLDSNDL